MIVSWTVSAGMAARMMNARAALNWDVPIAGHPALGTGEIGKLVSKPEYWEKVYQVGYRSCSYGPDGKLPKPNQDFVDSIRGKNAAGRHLAVVDRLWRRRDHPDR